MERFPAALVVSSVLLLGAVPSTKSGPALPDDPCVKAHQSHRDWTKTLACYDAAIKKDPGDLGARNGRAAVLAQLDRFREALTEYNFIVEKDPKNAMALNGRAMTLLALQRFDEGFQALELAIEADPKNVQALNNLGRLAFSSGKFEIADKSWRHVLSIDRNDLDARLGLGELRLRQAKTREAIELLAFVVQKRPDDARAHWMLGKALFAQDPGDAVEVLERAGSLAFRDPAVWYDLGLARLAIGDVRLAGQAFTHALELAPEEPKLYLELGKCYLEMREHEKAERFLTEALAKRPEPAVAGQVHFHRGVLRDRDGRAREAEAEYLKAAQLNPSMPLYRVNLGVLYVSQARHDEARTQFEKALEIDPSEPNARFNLGALLIERGQVEAGKAELKLLLRLPKSHPLRQDAELLLAGKKIKPPKNTAPPPKP